MKDEFHFAKAGYDAYCAATGWKSLISGAELPPFEDLKIEIKQAWKAAATGVEFALLWHKE